MRGEAEEGAESVYKQEVPQHVRRPSRTPRHPGSERGSDPIAELGRYRRVRPHLGPNLGVLCEVREASEGSSEIGLRKNS